jgi:polyisoprenoid-binding protein YceI
MNRFQSAAVFAALACGTLAAPSLAATQTFTIDGAHSQVGFSIRHFFSRVPGRFNEFSGTLQLDEKNFAASSVEATIKTASIFTANERRDTHLRSQDFFWADSFPTLTFKSTKITPGANGKLQIAGDLTMRGVTKPVVLDGSFLGAGEVGVGGRSMGYRASFEASTTVNRKDYGISWNKVLDQGGTMLGDDVNITIAIEAVRAEPEKAAAGAGQGEKK